MSSRRHILMQKQTGTIQIKRSFPEMLKGGVICDVVNAEQARIAEDAGASAVMALERVPADIRVQGGVARMSDPELIIKIKEAVTIPVMAKCRIGHFVEAEILQAIGVDCIDESEVLTPADERFHVNKRLFSIPFVCGARELGEALRRIGEGAALLRTKGEAGTGNIVEAVRHMRAVTAAVRRLGTLGSEELMHEAKTLGAPYELVRLVAFAGRLPVPNFAAGAAVLRRLGEAVREVRSWTDLAGLRALVLPGGESTALLRLMDGGPWFDALRAFHDGGGALLGTCAGAILLARDVDPAQPSLGLLDVSVSRNAYGRQVDSFEANLDAPPGGVSLRGVFIRAPRFTAIGPRVEVLARLDGEPVLV